MVGSCKSKVWKYFEFPVNDAGTINNNKEVYCNLCYHKLSYSGNTINLFYHLEAKHPSEFSEIAPKKKASRLSFRKILKGGRIEVLRE